MPDPGNRPAPTATPFDPRAPRLSPLALAQLQHAAGNAAAGAVVQRVREGPGVEVEPGVPQVVGPETPEAAPGEPAGPGAPTETSEPPGNRPVLRYGSTGDDVKLLQMKLHRVRQRMNDRDEELRVRIDGIFGPLTRADVIEFQSDAGLEADGIVGERTWHALDSLVPETPDESTDRARGEAFLAAMNLRDAGQYDEALPMFMALVETSMSPDQATTALANAAVCQHQRGRFGLAVPLYERSLRGRFNNEALRGIVLANLAQARANELLEAPPPDPEPAPPGAEAGATHDGGGVTPREEVGPGDTGEAVDLFKGKLAHLMVGWPPTMPDGLVFDDATAEKTRAFQAACGLEQTGEGDPATWHALDSFTRADVPFSVVRPLFARDLAAGDLSETDPAAALPVLEDNQQQARSLGLSEVVFNSDGLIGRTLHRLGRFAEAATRYEAGLPRAIPHPERLGYTLELLRRARRGEPAD